MGNTNLVSIVDIVQLSLSNSKIVTTPLGACSACSDQAFHHPLERETCSRRRSDASVIGTSDRRLLGVRQWGGSVGGVHVALNGGFEGGFVECFRCSEPSILPN